MKSPRPKISLRIYEDACEQSLGWCTSCQIFSRETTEPDAEGYKCPECEEMTVIGAEQAMLKGAFVLRGLT